MEIFGEEYGFLLTVGASADIADLCPNGDLNRIGELLDGKVADTIRFTASFIVAMSNGFDDAKRFAGEEVTHKPLTARMLLSLPSDIFREVQDAALKAFKAGTETTVQVAPSKKGVEHPTE